MKFRLSAAIIAIYFLFIFLWMALFTNASEDKITNSNLDLDNVNSQEVQQNVVETADSINVLESQPKPKLNNFLIYPSNDKFKYEILPFLSSKELIQIYLYFRNLYPALNFENFLPPSRFYTTNIVLDVKEPIYLQEFESSFILYRFENEYSSLQPPILYSKKNEIPTIFEKPINVKIMMTDIINETKSLGYTPNSIGYNSICALLSTKKIIPYTIHVYFGRELLTLRDNKDGKFLVTFQTNNGQFMNIAGGKLSKSEFYDYVECTLEAYFLQGWKRTYLKLKYYLMIPCVVHAKYLLCTERFFFLASILMGFIVLSFFRFLFLADHFKVFIFGVSKLTSFFIFGEVLALFYLYLFKSFLNRNEGTLENILNSFEIKPNKIMSAVPFLVQKRKRFGENYFVDLLKWCFLIFTLFIYWLSFFLKIEIIQKT